LKSSKSLQITHCDRTDFPSYVESKKHRVSQNSDNNENKSNKRKRLRVITVIIFAKQIMIRREVREVNSSSRF